MRVSTMNIYVKARDNRLAEEGARYRLTGEFVQK